jgi:hypothetical protein
VRGDKGEGDRLGRQVFPGRCEKAAEHRKSRIGPQALR